MQCKARMIRAGCSWRWRSQPIFSVYAAPLEVKTAQGKVHGKLINDGKVRAFLKYSLRSAARGRSSLESSAAACEVEGRTRCDKI